MSFKMHPALRALLLAMAVVLSILGGYPREAFAASFSVSPKFQPVGGVITVEIFNDSLAGADAADPPVPFSDIAVNRVNVLVKNVDRNVEIKMPAVETGTDTNTYRLAATVENQSEFVIGDGAGVVPGSHNETIRFSYGGFNHTVQIDSLEPTVEFVSPASEAVGPPGVFTFQATATDPDSSFTENLDDLNNPGNADRDSITLTIKSVVIESDGITCAPASASTLLGVFEVLKDDISWSKINDGWRLEASVPLGIVGKAQCIRWEVAAKDAAGNTDTEVRILKVDGEKPTLGPAVTGNWWDANESPTSRHKTGSDAKRTSVEVTFNDFSGLDEGSVSPDDFTVDSTVPIAVQVIDKKNEDDITPERKTPLHVFLTLPHELTSHVVPKVRVVGEIRDKAGNLIASGAFRYAQDGLPPKLAVSLNSTLSRESVTITIEPDEDLKEAPWVTLRVQDTAGGGLGSGDQLASSFAIKKADRLYELASGWNLEPFNLEPFKEKARRINVHVLATDMKDIDGTVGSVDDAEDSDAITYELDPLLNGGFDPEFTVAGKKIIDGKLQEANGTAGAKAKIEAIDSLVVAVDFSRQCGIGADPPAATLKCFGGGEKKEYEGDTHETVELTRKTASVTLNNGTVKSLPVTVVASDGIKFRLIVPGSDHGEYEVSVQARDEAGNVSKTPGSTAPDTLKASFTVVKPEPFDLALSPGWNLISLPFTTGDPSINSVIPASHPISLVMGYDQVTKVWRISQRNPDTGLFAGDLTIMTATTGYFVLTDSFQPLKLLRARSSTTTGPPQLPAIAVGKGWNLVPVASNASPPPDTVPADEYFGMLVTSDQQPTWNKALTYSALTNTWETVGPGDMLTVGLAYWIWVVEEGTIVP